MIDTIKLIAGLGNTGIEYEKTRHNVGFMFINKLDSREYKNEKQFRALMSAVEINENKVLLCKPTTMMNNSGTAVQNILHYFKIEPNQLLVAYDDLDIGLGDHKIQFAKGPKVHNGITSIINKIGSEKFWHLRIGIDNRTSELRKHISGADYVLGRFKQAERDKINKVLDEIIYNL